MSFVYTPEMKRTYSKLTLQQKWLKKKRRRKKRNTLFQNKWAVSHKLMVLPWISSIRQLCRRNRRRGRERQQRRELSRAHVVFPWEMGLSFGNLDAQKIRKRKAKGLALTQGIEKQWVLVVMYYYFLILCSGWDFSSQEVFHSFWKGDDTVPSCI